jgi:hypothetical protein
MLDQKVKRFFIATTVIVGIALAINIWEQATTSQANGAIQWVVLSIASAAILFTYIFAKYAATKGVHTKWVGRSLLIVIVLSLVLIQVATTIWGFTPQGWTF